MISQKGNILLTFRHSLKNRLPLTVAVLHGTAILPLLSLTWKPGTWRGATRSLSSLNPITTSSTVRQKEDITIISHLSGNLSKPKITFEFQLPERSDLRRDYLIVKKLEDFKNDENEMNKQVASLLLFNTFITSGQNFLSGEENILSQATSTIGGVVSGWLTNLFNKELLKATNGILSTYIDINPTVNFHLANCRPL